MRWEEKWSSILEIENSVVEQLRKVTGKNVPDIVKQLQQYITFYT